MRISRACSLSSTTRVGTPARSGMKRFGFSSDPIPNQTVKWKVLPTPCRLSAQMSADEERVKDFDARAASAAIARLRALLESSDGDAADAFLAVKDNLAGILERSQLNVLSTAINDFDFEAALLRLDEIVEIYGADSKEGTHQRG